MAELVAGACLSGIFEILFKEFGSRLFANFFRGKKSMEIKLRELKRKLETVSLVVNNSEARQITEPKVKKWLDDLKHAIHRAEDLVEDIKSEVRTKQRSRNHQSGSSRAIVLLDAPISPDQYTEFEISVQEEIVVISEDLDSLLDKRVVLGLKADGWKLSKSSLKVLPPPLREEHYVYGRDEDKEKILDSLLSDDFWANKIGVVPIVGLGGLGKTTLAQLVYDDERVKEHQFEIKAWVTVSTEFDVFKIIKTLLEQIGGNSKSDEPAILQREMKAALRGKRFLFVLDDVWDEDYENWDLLMSNFAPGDSRSKIIVTTRSGKVCSIVKTGPIHELKLVSEDDCWKIFVHHAFNGDLNADKELQEIGKRIVDRCKGLPLAVKFVGGLLRSERNPRKWEKILRSHVWEWSNQAKGVLPSLWLSYHHLHSSVKQCFAYCAIFPQDYIFNKKDMVLLWMAEGFLQADTNEESLEEVGEEYFEDLISRSFFQRQKYDESSYVMHDLVHDLATFVSGEFCLNLSRNKRLDNTSSKTRYLFCDFWLQSDSMRTFTEDTHLRTYIDERWIKSSPLADEIMEVGRFLRVISVQRQDISLFLSSPRNNLKHLRYLNLSGSRFEEVPDSICTLHNLQTLLLLKCHRISKFPTKIGNLINLRHLDTTDSDLNVENMPPRMGNLKELRTLSDFILGKADDGGSSIEELGKLHHLSGKLHVRGLQNVETDDAAQKASFGDKESIRELVLEWSSETTDTRRDRDVLDALRPHTNLKALSILGYQDSSLPNWVGNSSFSRMISMKLRGGWHDLCHSLPPLGQLPSLKELEIKSFHGVENIGSEFYGNRNSSIPPFPCLETLKFEDMKKWKEWSYIGGESRCFPRLKRLSLKRCPNLGARSLLDCETLENLQILDSYDSMEFFPLEKFSRLESLHLAGFPKLKSLTTNKEGLPLASLNSLVIENCNKLVAKSGHWDLQRLTSLTSLSIVGCRADKDSDSDSFPQGLLPESLSSFQIWRFQQLKSLNNTSFTQLKSLKSLTIWECHELESLPEQVLLNSSSSIVIHDCPFLERRYHKEKGEDWHYISHIPYKLIWGNTSWELDRIELESKNSMSSV